MTTSDDDDGDATSHDEASLDDDDVDDVLRPLAMDDWPRVPVSEARPLSCWARVERVVLVSEENKLYSENCLALTANLTLVSMFNGPIIC